MLIYNDLYKNKFLIIPAKVEKYLSRDSLRKSTNGSGSILFKTAGKNVETQVERWFLQKDYSERSYRLNFKMVLWKLNYFFSQRGEKRRHSWSYGEAFQQS